MVKPGEWMGRLGLRTRLIGLQVIAFGGLILICPAIYLSISHSLDRQFEDHLRFLARSLSHEYAHRTSGMSAHGGPPSP